MTLPERSYRVVCSKCDHVYLFAGSGDIEFVRTNMTCGECGGSLAVPPTLQVLPGGRISA